MCSEQCVRDVRNGFFNFRRFRTVFDKSWTVRNPEKPLVLASENPYTNTRTGVHAMLKFQANTEIVKLWSSLLSVLRSQN